MQSRAPFRILIAGFVLGVAALACRSPENAAPAPLPTQAPRSSATAVPAGVTGPQYYSAFSAELLNEIYPPAELKEGIPAQAVWDDYSTNPSFQQLAKSLGPDTKPTVACLTAGQVGYVCECQIEFFNLPNDFSMTGLQDTVTRAFASINKEFVWLDPGDYPGQIHAANVEVSFLTTIPLNENTLWVLSGYRMPGTADRAYVMVGEFDAMFTVEEAWDITSGIIQNSFVQK